MIDRLAWITTAAARGLDDDEPLALAALARAGVAVDVVDWDDPGVRWPAYRRAVLRSAWDYPERLPEFRRRLRTIRAATELRNPLPVVEWNLDKHYLAELARAGVLVTPTTFVEPGAEFHLPAGDFVLKPAIGAGSRDAAWYGPEQAEPAAAHVRRLHDRGTSVLVQPRLASVAVDGEWPLVYLGGRYSHAASKRVDLPRGDSIQGLFAAETSVPHAADAEQRAVADAAMAVVTRRFGPLTYARVDLVRADDGHVCVLELELIEPSLFLPLADAAAVDRLVAALTAD